MYNSHSNNNDNSNSTNYANTTDAQVTFNQRKTSELRQTRLQRQHEQLHHLPPTQLLQSPDTLGRNQTPVTQSAQHANGEKSRSPNLAQRLTRRKRLQRQKPTELDDADFAYAADLEEEDEEEEHVLKQQSQASNMFSVTPLMETMCTAELQAPPFAQKHLSHFQQQHHSTPFDGQPSSLPNCFATAGSISTYHHQHQQHQHHHHHQHQQLQQQNNHHMSYNHHTAQTTTTLHNISHHPNHLQQTHAEQQLPGAELTHTTVVGVVGMGNLSSCGAGVGGGSGSVVVTNMTSGLLSRKQSSKYEKRGVSITESQVSC